MLSAAATVRSTRVEQAPRVPKPLRRGSELRLHFNADDARGIEWSIEIAIRSEGQVLHGQAAHATLVREVLAKQPDRVSPALKAQLQTIHRHRRLHGASARFQ